MYHIWSICISQSWTIIRFCIKPMVIFFIDMKYIYIFNTLNAELNPICHLLALLGAHHILHVSRKRVKYYMTQNPSGVGSKRSVYWDIQCLFEDAFIIINLVKTEFICFIRFWNLSSWCVGESEWPREEYRRSSLSLREEISLGSWRKLHNAEIYDFYSATNIIRVINSQTVKWPESESRIGEKGNT